jgi:erythromycin esterase-like protein
MSGPAPGRVDAAHTYATLDDWIARDAIPFSIDSSNTLNATVDRVVASLGGSVELLGFGEAMHGSEDILILRNRIFERLVAAHGYSAIAIESGFPEGHLVDQYVSGGIGTYDSISEKGFSWSFGRLDANRELVEWMRRYNADPAHRVKLRFYGFDISAIIGAQIYGPDRVLHLALDYLSVIDTASGQAHRQRIDSLLTQLSGWENPAVWVGKAEAPGLTAAATALRIATEDLITELRTRRPELVAKSSEDGYLEALQYAHIARQTLNFHAALARSAAEPPAGVRGVRDALMADNLTYIVDRERGRGKVFVYAHNGHLQRGISVWPCCGQKFKGTDVYTWWPAGSQLNEMLGKRYAVIGTAVGVSAGNGIGPAETGTLEARLAALPGPAVFISTHDGLGLPATELAALKPRSGSELNPTYTVLEAHSVTDFDWLAVLDSTAYARGSEPLKNWTTGSKPKAQ